LFAAMHRLIGSDDAIRSCLSMRTVELSLPAETDRMYGSRLPTV